MQVDGAAPTGDKITNAKEVEAGEEEEQEATGAKKAAASQLRRHRTQLVTPDESSEHADKANRKAKSPDSITAELNGTDGESELNQLFAKLDREITEDTATLQEGEAFETLKSEITRVRQQYGNTTSGALDDIFIVTECDKHGNPLSNTVLYELSDASDRWAVGNTAFKCFQTMRVSPLRSTKAKVRPQHHRFLHPCICTCAILRRAQPPCSCKF